MSILETILVFAVIPLAIYGLFALLTLRSRFAGRPRYRPGQAWEYPPTWWSANSASAGDSHAAGETATPSTVRGGASGRW
ncbi:hypothetical protein ABZ863_28145 [Saccharomonospora sp. NPDC046836]|uniref:aa3-type cytochrome oxidase subunit CtaJ n=1 Tax=Saccharomonospora sp. NPDC046836 TaxID=3156921 RepID=UPI0033D2B929